MDLKRGFLLFLSGLLFLAVCVSSTQRKYSGDKVLLITPHTHKALIKLRRTLQRIGADVWAHSFRVDVPCEVRVNKIQYARIFVLAKSHSDISIRVSIENVEQVIEGQRWTNRIYKIMAKAVYRSTTPPFNYELYNRYNDIIAELHKLQLTYPHLVRVRRFGSSFEGRGLYIVKISTKDTYQYTKPIIWIEAGAHAREWISTAATLYIMKKMLMSYNKDRSLTHLIRRHVFMFVPVFNPDGYEFSHTDERLWRKTRTTYANGTCVGADPNRNWDVQWETGLGASNNSCAGDYHGVRPHSEPCVRAHARILRRYKNRIISYWSIHSFFQLLVYPSSYTITPPKRVKEMEKVGKEFIQAVKGKFKTRYDHGRVPTILGMLLAGVSIDYVHDKLGVTHSYAIELRDRGPFGFLLPAEQIAPTAEELLDGLEAAWLYIDKSKSINNSRRVFKELHQSILQSRSNITSVL